VSDIKQYLPNIYDAILEFEGLIASENALFDNLDTETEKVRDNQYILTADIDGIIAYEKMLNIIPKPAAETTEFRRQRIINRLSMVPPFTFRFLKQKLDEIIGVDRYTASIDYPNYTLYVESSAENQEWFHEILVTVTKLKPANIVFINRPLVYGEIIVGESINLTQVNFNYRLGSTWVLGLKPFTSLDDMGVIKVATTPSIKQDLLNHMATFTASDIADVRINGTFMVPAFVTKAAVNNLVTVEYEVSETDGIPEITQIELLDSAGTVLADSAVYVPILERVILKHNILIKEGV
jgi:hypothetical protein